MTGIYVGKGLKAWDGQEWTAWGGQEWTAWTINGTTYYTKSATPSVGDKVYNSNRQDTGKTISTTGSGTITFGSGSNDLYAWTIANASSLDYPSWASTFYTNSVPTTVGASYVYDANGTPFNVFQFGIKNMGEGYITEATNSSITINCVGPG